MYKKGKLIALATTAVAAAAVLIGGSVYASNVDTPAVVAKQLGSAELMQVLVPDAQQPASSSIASPITIADAVAAHLFEPAPGLTSSPSDCIQLNAAIGDLGNMVGWVQTGERDASVAPASLFRGFTQAVFQVPGGANAAIDRVASIVNGCGGATISIDLGGAVQTGISKFSEQAGPALSGATTYAFTQVTTLDAIDAYGTDTEVEPSPSTTDPEVCTVQGALIGVGDTLIWLQEPTYELLSAATKDTYERLQAVSDLTVK